MPRAEQLQRWRRSQHGGIPGAGFSSRERPSSWWAASITISAKSGASLSSYRYFALNQLTTNQIDIGGALPGDTLGIPAARAPRPQKPEFLVGGLTTTINPTTDERFPFQLYQDLVAVGNFGRAAATSRVGRGARNRRRDGECADPVQRQQPEYPPAILGRSRHHAQGRS